MADNDAKYKLLYFNVKGLAEPIRYMFAYADVPFIDQRITREEWEDIKKRIPFQKLPVLEFDGKELNQSIAIARYVGKRYGFGPGDLLQETLLESSLDCLRDLLKTIYDEYTLKTVASTEAANKATDSLFTSFEETISRDGYLCGNKVTWLDIFFAGIMDTLLDYKPDILNPFPQVTEIIEKIKRKDSVKEYITTRPPYDPLNL